VIKALRFLRPVAAVVLFFVTWQFCMVSEIVAFALEPAKASTAEVLTSAVVGRFDKTIGERDLAALDAEVEAGFEANAKRLVAIGAGSLIRTRQKKAQEAYRKLSREMRRLLKAQGGSQEQAGDSGSSNLAAFLKTGQSASRQPVSQPLSLSHRAAKARTIIPRQTREDYARRSVSGSSGLSGGRQGLLSSQSSSTPGIGAPGPEDLAATVDAQLSEAIRAKAVELGNQPLPIYQWVRNNVEFVPTHGSIQGADYCLQTLKCNAIDSASLLVALLRAGTIPARYAFGTIEVPAGQAMQWLGGVDQPELAVEILNMGGIPAVGVVEGSQITKIRLEHVWVEAWLDYVPGRGAVHRAGDTWIPMDPSWKQEDVAAGIDLGAVVPFDAPGLLADLATTIGVNETDGSITGQVCSPVGGARTEYEAAVRSYLTASQPDATIGDLLGGRTITPDRLPIFPSVLPYEVTATAARLTTVPVELRHALRVTLKLGTTTSLDVSRALPQLGGSKITLGYVPAGAEDVAVIAAYLPEGVSPATLAELPTALPGYLIEVRPELRIDGVVVATGVPTGLGTAQDLAVTFTGASGETDLLQRTVRAGEYSALTLDLGTMASGKLAALRDRLDSTAARTANGEFAGLTREELLGDPLFAAGSAYFADLDQLLDVRSKTEGMLSQRLPSAVLSRSTLAVREVFGVVLQAGAGSLALDELRGVGVLASRHGARDKAAGFALSAALDAGAYSHLIGEQLFSSADEPVVGISPVRVLAQALADGIPVYTITSANAAGVLPLLQLDQELKLSIEAAVHAGFVTLAPASPVTVAGWTGGACLIVDPATGDTTGLLSGGYQGAVLAGPAWVGKAIALNLGAAADPALQALYRASASDGLASGFASVVTGVAGLDNALASANLDRLLSGALSGALADGMGCLLDAAPPTTDLGGCLAAALGQVCLASAQTLIASANNPPVAEAGAARRVNAGSFVVLDGRGSSDPERDVLHYRWSFVSRPPGSMAVLSDASAVRPSFVADKVGDYTLALAVHDGRIYGAPDSVVVTAEPDLVAVPAVAGMPLAAAEVALAASGLTLGAVDQQPHPSVAAWNVVSQSPAAAANATRGSAVDLVISTGPSLDTEKPTLTVTIDRSIPVYPAGTPVVVTVIAEDDSDTVAVAMSVDGTSVPVVLPETTLVTAGMAAGSRHTIRVTATDPAGNATSRELVFGILNPADATEPLVAITSPADNVEVTAPVEVVGTAFDSSLVRWRLSCSPVGESGETLLAEGTAAVTDSTLGTFDPTLLKNGLYVLRLAATDAGGRELVAETVVRVAGEMKVGNFTVSFTDLEIPVAGLPVRVVRTYDSRDKGQGDFGIGWRVDFKSVTTQENMTPGRGWYQESDGDPYMPTWCISGEHYVTVTLPDGKTEEFDAVPEPQCNFFWPIEEVTVSYAARPGTTSTLQAGNPGPFYVANGSFLDYDGAEVFDPSAYTLTALDGTIYELDQSFGMRKAVDPNGNSVTYGQNGIIHSAGKSVAFTRDAQGRITKITDPDGQVFTYDYDSRGDLTAVTDRGGSVTRLGYDLRHNLGTIQDPRGVTPLRNEYDDAGRLVAHVDSHGKRIVYTHDIAGRREIVQDRLGRQSLYVYDDNGRVLAKTDPDGRTVAYTYDVLGNKTSETDPLGNLSRWTYDDKRSLLSETKVLDGVDVTTRHTYTPKGRLLTTTDPMGHVTSNWYDTKGNLLTVTDALGGVTTNTYDAGGNLATSTDPLEHTTTYSYDGAGNLLSQTDSEGNSTTYTYDANGNKLTETDPRGGVTRYDYDASGRQVAVTDALGHVTRTEYDKAGARIAEIDALGVRTAFVYDVAGKLIRTNHPDGTATSISYDAEGNRTSSVDQLGRETRYEYDENKRLVRTIYPDGADQQYGYDAAGRQTTVTDASGKTTTKVCDALGRVTRSIDQEEHATAFTYDLNGNQLTQTDANGHTTTFGHDAAGRVTTTTLAGGEASSVDYDALGRKTSETDAAGKITQFGYDARGNLTSVTDAMGGITRYEYDGSGNRTAIVDARGNRTTFVYDGLNRLVAKTMPSGSMESFAYDAAGRQSVKTKADSSAIQYAYDVQGRLMGRAYPDGSGVDFAYTATGRRASASDRRGITNYVYDVRDRLLGQTYPDTQSIGYTYDPNGQIASVSSMAGTIQYRYTASGRLHEVEDPQGRVTSYGYDPAGNRTGLSYPNGTTVSYGYDTNNRLRTLEHKNSVAQVIASYAYTLGATGNRTRIDENTGISRVYQYDNLYRLTQDAVSDPAGAQAYTDDYSYDAVGNRLTKTHAAGAVPGVAAEYAYNNADQLLTENGITYTYDLNGNLKTKTDASGTTTYTWDYEDRLLKVAGPGGTVTYEYDVDGNRVSSTTAAGTTRYLVDTNRALAQVLAEYTPAGSLTASYVYADDLISMTRGGLTRWYHFDGLGSTRMLTDESGAVTDTYSYDAFGNLIARTGTTQNDFLFTGQQRDANAGWYYLRARWMDPSVGRFTSVDPFGAGSHTPIYLHRYGYAGANPVNSIDPSGLLQGSLVETNVSLGIQDALITIWISLYVGKVFLEHSREAAIESGLKSIQVQYGNFQCTKFAVDAANFLNGKGKREGDDWNLIVYKSYPHMTTDVIIATIGRYAGSPISDNGFHAGVIYRRKGEAQQELVSDNNVLLKPRREWEYGYEVSPKWPPALIPIALAEQYGLGKITTTMKLTDLLGLGK